MLRAVTTSARDGVYWFEGSEWDDISEDATLETDSAAGARYDSSRSADANELASEGALEGARLDVE